MKNLKSSNRRGELPSPKGSALLPVALGALLALAPAAALADVHIQGTPQALTIQAQNASISEILAALDKEYGLRYRSTANLDKQVTGTYEGSLSQLLGRLLTGYNFIVKSSEGRIDVSILGSRPGGIVASSTAAAVAQPLAAPAAALPATAASKPAQGADTVTATQAPAEPASAPQPDIPTPTESGIVPPVVKVAEGPMPPLPTPGAKGPVPEAKPSDVSAPMPTPLPPGSNVSAPEPKPSTVQPPQFVANPKPVDNPLPTPDQGPKTVPAPPPSPTAAPSPTPAK